MKWDSKQILLEEGTTKAKPSVGFAKNPNTGFYYSKRRDPYTPIQRFCECFGLHGSTRPCPIHGPWNDNVKNKKSD